MLRLGQVIDRYEVTSLIGRGGMAVVYGLRHRNLGSAHALKVLELSSPAIRRRFELEGRVQASLNHPNVVTVTDTIEVEGQPALVMEYVGGPSLDTYLDLCKPDRETALALFKGIASGVAHAHGHGLVHRDLKPGNVMLAVTEHGILPKVCDFGLAKVIHGDELAGGRATRTGAAMGTPTYMAPEQLEDASRVDHRADIYALGAILYELVCFRPPYDAAGLMEVIQMRLDGPYDRPESLVDDLPEDLVALIDDMLSENPDDRPENMRVVLERIEGEKLLADTLPPAPPLTGPIVGDVKLIGRPEPLSEDRAAFTQPALDMSAFSQDFAEVFDGAERAAGRRRRVAMGVGLAGLLLLLVGLTAATGGALWWTITGQEPVDNPLGADAGSEDSLASDGESEGEGTADGEDRVAEPEPDPGGPPTPGPRPGPATQPEPAPAAQPDPPQPDPAPLSQAPGPRVTITGDAELVYLRLDGRDYQPSDALPAGTYEIRAVFAGAAPVSAGRVTLGSGEQVTLKCTSGFQMCSPR